MGGPAPWWGVINNICPISVSIHIAAGSGRGRRRVSPIPEIHLNLCANSMKGKGHIWRVWLSPPQGRPGLQILQANFGDNRSRTYTQPHSYSLAYLSHTLTHTHSMLLCYYTGSNSVLQYVLVTSLIVHNIHFQSKVCGALCRIQLFKTSRTPINALHSPFKIVKVFPITVYTLNNSWWETDKAFVICTVPVQ